MQVRKDGYELWLLARGRVVECVNVRTDCRSFGHSGTDSLQSSGQLGSTYLDYDI